MDIYVPFELIALEEESYHILISCIINGEQGDLVIDTGASKTVFDSNFVCPDMMPNNIDSELKSTGLGGTNIETGVLKIDSFVMGELYIQNKEFAIIDLSQINIMYQEHCNRSIAGLLGSDFFVKYSAIIDYAEQRICFQI